MVSQQGLKGPLHPIKRRALQGPLIHQKVVPVVLLKQPKDMKSLLWDADPCALKLMMSYNAMAEVEVTL